MMKNSWEGKPAEPFSQSSVFGALGVGLLILLLYFGAPILLPAILAFFLSLLLDPGVKRLENLRVPRTWAALALVITATLLFSAIGYAFYHSLTQVMDRVPRYSEKISVISHRLHRKAMSIQESTDLILAGGAPSGSSTPVQKVEIVGAKTSSPITGYILRGFNSALNLATLLFFIPLISFFLLCEKEFLRLRVQSVVQDTALFETICFELRSMARGFFVGNFFLGMSMSLCFACLFVGMKLEDAPELSLLAGFLNLIPVFGALLGGVVPGVQALLQFDSLAPSIWIAVSSLVIHFIGNNLFLPKLLGARVNVNHTAAVLGFLFWGTLWGAMGLFLAIPLMSILRLILLSRESCIPYANLIGQIPVVGAQRIYTPSSFRDHGPSA